MKGRLILSLGALAPGALAQGSFEPPDFNITEALIGNGVDVSSIPELEPLIEKRSLSSPCAVAVGLSTIP